MKPVSVLKSKVGRRVAPVLFVALAGISLAACGSSGGSSGSGTHNTPTTKPAGGSGGGAGF
jgi:hypothetical protein